MSGRHRLILPITYFVEKLFENWTRSDACIILYLDYTVPVDKLREKAQKLAQEDPLWTSERFAVQVIDILPICIQVRILVSVPDSPSTFGAIYGNNLWPSSGMSTRRDYRRPD